MRFWIEKGVHPIPSACMHW